jgi:hypothetical protein
MVVRVHGGALYGQSLTGNLRHYRILDIDFSGALSDGSVIIPGVSYGLDSQGHQIVHVVPEGTPVPGSSAEVIFLLLGEKAQVGIMNPSVDGLFFALENDDNGWTISDMQFAIRNLGTDVGIDHVDLHLAIIEEVPYELGTGLITDQTFLELTDTPGTYTGSANKVVTVSPDQTQLVFTALVMNDLFDVNTTGITSGQTLVWNGTNFVPTTPKQGTVTSVGLTLPNIFSVTGSPITSAGTLSATLNAQPANTLLSGPTTGTNAVPTFRKLVNTDIPANLVISGTGSVTVPSGTTAERPVAVNSQLRYNTETNALETPISSVWQSIVLDDDYRLASFARTVLVTPDAHDATEFDSIALAAASITTATQDSPWVVRVTPGVYIEPEIILPPYVHLIGIDGTASTIVIQPDNGLHPVVSIGSATSINQVTIKNAVGTDQVAINTTGGDVHNVAIRNCSVGVDIHETGSNITVILDGVTIVPQAGQTGIRATSTTHALTVEALSVFMFSTTTNLAFGCVISGPLTRFDAKTVSLKGVDGTGTGILIQNGSRANIQSLTASGWDIGVHLPNTGAAQVAAFSGGLNNNTSYDLLVEHPDATGSLTGSANLVKVDASLAHSYTLAFSDPTNNGYVQTGEFYLGTDASALTSVTSLIVETPPIGLYDGGVISAGTGLNATVSAGSGYIRLNGNIHRVEWPDQTIPLDANTVPYLYINSSGVVQDSATMVYTENSILLGRAATDGDSIYSAGQLSTNIKNYGNRVETYLRETTGPVFSYGSNVSEDVSLPRSINVTAGRWYYGTQQRNPSSSSAPEVVDIYHNAGDIVNTSSQQIDNSAYDNGVTLVSVTPGYYIKHSLLQSGEGIYQSYFLAHATAEYATLDDAISAPDPIPLVDYSASPHIASLIMQQGVDSIVKIIDIRPLYLRGGGTINSAGGTATIHSGLLGLTNDDHPQYSLVDGTRAMSGNLDLGTNDIVNVGTVNGIQLNAHGAQHAPNSTDPLPTGAAVSISAASVNSEGISNLFARSDHTHAITGTQAFDLDLTNISSMTGVGIAVRSNNSTSSWITTSITGTANQIVVANGNAVTASPSISIAPNPVLTGTQAVTIPSGTTAQQGTPVPGMFRFNTVANVFEGYNGTAWVDMVKQGTVTSVSASGGTTGLTFAGNPITTSGTVSLTGTLAITNGGTGQITANAAFNALAPAQTGNSGKVLTTDGTNTSWAPPGSVLQVVSGTIPRQSGTALFVYDTSSPTITDGFQILSLTFTPMSATSRIIVQFPIWVSASNNNRIITCGIYSGTTCQAAIPCQITSQPNPGVISMLATWAPGSTAPITISVNVGANGAGITYVNQTSAATLGSAGATSYTIMEVV